MNDDNITYHVSPEDEVPQAAPDVGVKVNLFERLEDTKNPPAPAPPEPTPPIPPAVPAATATGSSDPVPHNSRRLTKRLAAVAAVLLLVASAAGVYAYQASQQLPVAEVPEPTLTPNTKATRSPSARPSARPSTKPSPAARPAPTPAKPPSAPGTYTVQPGDTLITIGDKLKKDWRAIAAANNVPNPNFISPGQVLRIP